MGIGVLSELFFEFSGCLLALLPSILFGLILVVVILIARYFVNRIKNHDIQS